MYVEGVASSLGARTPINYAEFEVFEKGFGILRFFSQEQKKRCFCSESQNFKDFLVSWLQS